MAILNKTYLFYDLETTGLNKAFDQVIQFAAIRTSLDFKEIERVEYKIRLNRDVVPTPEAFLTHGIRISDLADGLTEYSSMQAIHAMLNQPGTISVGYNTLGFDDEFLRFSFYRNLLTPYTHQYAQNCSRMDIYPLTLLYHLFQKDVLTWPKLDGKTTLKLEHVANANNLMHGAAHDAMVDVDATVGLAKCLASKPEVWQYALGYFDKLVDQQRIAQLPVAMRSQQGLHYHGMMLSGNFGAAQFYQAPVLCLGWHRQYKNQLIWLRLDLEKLQKTTLEDVTSSVWTINKKLGEPNFILPAKNHYMQYLTPERQRIMQENLQWLNANSAIFNKLIEYHTNFTYPNIPDLDSEAALYQNGFLNDYEQKLCQQFHAAPITEKDSVVEKFSKDSLRTLATRIIARNFPETLTSNMQEDYQNYWQRLINQNDNNIIVDYKGLPRLTPQQALQRIDDLQEQATGEQQVLLSELSQYIVATFV